MHKDCILMEELLRFKGVREGLQGLLQVLRTAERTLEHSAAVDYRMIEQAVAEGVAGVERGAHEDLLQLLDPGTPRVEIRGKVFACIGRTMGHYRTLAGEITFERSVYRELGVRNGPTVDPISLRIGAIGGCWLPQAAQAMSYLMQQGTPREAEAASREMGRLPYSKSSFDRVAHEVGKILDVNHLDIEDTLCQQSEVPKEATSISVSIDRVSVPMEEPRTKPVGRPRRDAPKRPIERNFRMAWCGTATFHDSAGEALSTVRYGMMPRGDPREMGMLLANEVFWALHRRDDLEVMLLADGAPDLWDLLEESCAEEVIGKKAHRLIDFWHLMEKLAAAARAIHGDAALLVMERWRHELRTRSSAAADILSELEASGCEEPKVHADRPVHQAITYLSNHGHRMNYARARRRCLPIGSGNVEATCKSLIATRMKRAGSRWKHQTGGHIIQLRALALSDRWTAAMDLLTATQRCSVGAAA